MQEGSKCIDFSATQPLHREGTGDHRERLQASATATKTLLSLEKRTGSACTKSTKAWREGRESSAYPSKAVGTGGAKDTLVAARPR